MNQKYYAVYRGDKLICHGTSWECAEFLRVTPDSIRFLSYKPHHKRVQQAKNPDLWLVAIKVDELDEMGN